ncbi:MAG: hypothetical protein PHG42_09415, partial [Bacteroides sp.]|nr:hypothetical protein [Bacteroides sp.]
WETKVVSSNTPIELFNVVDEYSQLDTYALPETSTVSRRIKNNELSFSFNINDEASRFYWKKYIRKDVEGRLATLNKTTHFKNTVERCKRYYSFEGGIHHFTWHKLYK